MLRAGDAFLLIRLCALEQKIGSFILTLKIVLELHAYFK